MRSALLVLFLCSSMSSVASAEEVDPALQGDIMKLMELTGAALLGEQMGQIMTAQFLDGMKQAGFDFPQRGIEILREVMNEEVSGAFSGPYSMMDDMVAIYAKHYTHGEIKELIVFYESPLGTKVRSTMPVLLVESADVGQRWAQSVMPRFQEKLRLRLIEEGVISSQ